MSSRDIFRRFRTGTAMLALALSAAACAPVDPGMGEAVRYDALAQTANPDPVYAPTARAPGYSGDHGVKASERYRKGTVKAPQRESLGSGSGSGGSGGGGSAGSGPQ